MSRSASYDQGEYKHVASEEQDLAEMKKAIATGSTKDAGTVSASASGSLPNLCRLLDVS